MDLAHFFLRIALWFRRPPSREFMIVAAIVLVLAAAIATVEWLGYWPDALRVERGPRI